MRGDETKLQQNVLLGATVSKVLEHMSYMGSFESGKGWIFHAIGDDNRAFSILTVLPIPVPLPFPILSLPTTYPYLVLVHIHTFKSLSFAGPGPWPFSYVSIAIGLPNRAER